MDEGYDGNDRQIATIRADRAGAAETAARDTPAVLAEAMILGNNLDRFGSIVERVERTLQPVLRPPHPMEATVSSRDDRATPSPLTDTLREHNRRFGDLNDRLDEILARVEV